MNKRFFIHKITVYHLENEEKYIPIYFNEVYFRHNKKTNLIDKGIEKGSTGSITIPTIENLNITNYDYIVEGIIEDEFNLPVFKKVSTLSLRFSIACPCSIIIGLILF